MLPFHDLSLQIGSVHVLGSILGKQISVTILKHFTKAQIGSFQTTNMTTTLPFNFYDASLAANSTLNTFLRVGVGPRGGSFRLIIRLLEDMFPPFALVQTSADLDVGNIAWGTLMLLCQFALPLFLESGATGPPATVAEIQIRRRVLSASKLVGSYERTAGVLTQSEVRRTDSFLLGCAGKWKRYCG